MLDRGPVFSKKQPFSGGKGVLCFGLFVFSAFFLEGYFRVCLEFFLMFLRFFLGFVNVSVVV